MCCSVYFLSELISRRIKIIQGTPHDIAQVPPLSDVQDQKQWERQLPPDN